MYVTTEFDRVVGFCAVACGHKDHKVKKPRFTGRATYIEATGVHPDCQGKGIGSRLLNAVFDDDKDVMAFESWVREKNERRLRMLRSYAQKNRNSLDITEEVVEESNEVNGQGKLISVLLRRKKEEKKGKYKENKGNNKKS